ncbi:MAG: HD domain-containing protein [Cyanobium sp. MAG06]|nr:HD domain-containing protein [Cyanobium sp. MAG06]
MNDILNNDLLEKILDIGILSEKYANTYRVTLFSDGKTPESDTDHTFMLGLLCTSLTDKYYKDKMDIGLISQFVLIHDLVEVYAGDTDTVLNKSTESIKLKEDKERLALEMLESKFYTSFPYITETIKKYESQDTKEARFVKIVDKLTPEITNIINNNAYFKNTNKNYEYIYNHFEFKTNKYKYLLEEFPEINEIFTLMKDKILKEY